MSIKTIFLGKPLMDQLVSETKNNARNESLLGLPVMGSSFFPYDYADKDGKEWTVHGMLIDQKYLHFASFDSQTGDFKWNEKEKAK